MWELEGAMLGKTRELEGAMQGKMQELEGKLPTFIFFNVVLLQRR
jgi:hypothetical protein